MHILVMSLPQLAALTLVEIVGDYGLKEYANGGGWPYLHSYLCLRKGLATGVVGYIGMVVALIVNLQGSSILLVNNAWVIFDGEFVCVFYIG